MHAGIMLQGRPRSRRCKSMHALLSAAPSPCCLLLLVSMHLPSCQHALSTSGLPSARCRGVFVVGIALILFNRIEWEKAPDPVRACCAVRTKLVRSIQCAAGGAGGASALLYSAIRVASARDAAGCRDCPCRCCFLAGALMSRPVRICCLACRRSMSGRCRTF